ncbi:MAG: hypothetical protein OEY34_06275 [Cyclobacteriaceae bacterium]|nr:hypothetical protein [Cyclobacteriaceae bacterium]
MIEKSSSYRQKSIWLTLLVQLIVSAALYFIIAWKEPFPPIPEYGIELNFGFSEEGVGDQETELPVPSEMTENDALENEETGDETAVNEPQPDDSNEVPVVPETESPDVAEENSVTDNQVTPQETTEKTVTNEVVASKSTKENTAAPVATSGETGKTGNQGVETGKIDERALYGNPGDQQGAFLQLSGWKLSKNPVPNDQSQESGKIVYQLTVDEDGYVIGVRVISSTVTPAVEIKYRNAVQKLQLESSGDNSKAQESTGTITFIIKSK